MPVCAGGEDRTDAGFAGGRYEPDWGGKGLALSIRRSVTLTNSPQWLKPRKYNEAVTAARKLLRHRNRGVPVQQTIWYCFQFADSRDAGHRFGRLIRESIPAGGGALMRCGRRARRVQGKDEERSDRWSSERKLSRGAARGACAGRGSQSH